MNDPEDSCVTNHDDDARNHKGNDKERRLAAPAVRVLEDGACAQLFVIPKGTWNEEIGSVSVLVSGNQGQVNQVPPRCLLVPDERPTPNAEQSW